MKYFNSLKLVSSFKEISNVLEVISAAIRIMTFALVILQGILVIRDAKTSIDKS